jgi:hypothetical protein
MSIRVLVFACLALQPFRCIDGQEPARTPISRPQGPSLSDIGGAMPWHHIGAPLSPESAAPRVAQWQAEVAYFREAFEAIRQTWTGEAVDSPGELRSKVGRYEDLVRTVTDSGGYGNLLLADTLRRLSVGLLVRYVMAHPSDYAVVGEILETNRVRLLDCAAVGNMLTEELKLAPPSGQWHLSESQKELELIFIADGSSLHEAGLGMLVGGPGPSSLIAKRDITALLSRLMATESTERMVLAGFLEFLKQGGTVADLGSFEHIMAKEKSRFQFPPLGVSDATIRVGYIAALLKAYQPWEGRAVPFSALVGE